VWIARRPGILPTAKATGTPAPAPPAANAPAADFAAWREQQTAWKAENVAYRQQQNAERAAAFRSLHEEQRAEWSARQAVARERNRRSRPNPLFTVLVIGLALIAGGLTTLSLKGGELEVTTAVAGLAVAVAVLALGMIVNGIRGKRAGGASGLAGLLLLPLVLFTAFPQNTHFQYTSAYFAPENESGSEFDLYVAGGRGGVVLDVEDYYDDEPARSGSFESNDIVLVVLSGSVQVHVPDDAYTVVDATAPSGGVRIDDDDNNDGFDTRGRSTSVRFNEGAAAKSQLTVHVFVLNGTITIID